MLKRIVAVGLLLNAFSGVNAMMGLAGSWTNHQQINMERLQDLIRLVDDKKEFWETADSQRKVEKHLWTYRSSIFEDRLFERYILCGVESCCYPIITTGTCCNWIWGDMCGTKKTDQCLCCYELPESIKLGCVMVMAKIIVEDYTKQNAEHGSDNV